MIITDKSALLVSDIQQEDFVEMTEANAHEPRWQCIRNGKRVLDVFRSRRLPIIQIKELHRADMMMQSEFSRKFRRSRLRRMSRIPFPI